MAGLRTWSAGWWHIVHVVEWRLWGKWVTTFIVWISIRRHHVLSSEGVWRSQDARFPVTSVARNVTPSRCRTGPTVPRSVRIVVFSQAVGMKRVWSRCSSCWRTSWFSRASSCGSWLCCWWVWCGIASTRVASWRLSSRRTLLRRLAACPGS